MQGLEALWAIRFGPPESPVSAGTLIFETGRIFGGDSMFAYVGTYEVDGEHFTGSVRVMQHFAAPDMIDLWQTGEPTFDVSIYGVRLSADLLHVRLARAHHPSIDAHLIRVVDLP